MFLDFVTNQLLLLGGSRPSGSLCIWMSLAGLVVGFPYFIQLKVDFVGRGSEHGQPNQAVS